MRCDPKEERAEKIIISAVEKLDEVEGKDGKIFREAARTVFKVLRLERREHDSDGNACSHRTETSSSS